MRAIILFIQNVFTNITGTAHLKKKRNKRKCIKFIIFFHHLIYIFTFLPDSRVNIKTGGRVIIIIFITLDGKEIECKTTLKRSATYLIQSSIFEKKKHYKDTQ